MKTHFLSQPKFLGFVAAVAACISIRADPTFLTNGLFCYFPFSGNASDASGHGYVPFVTNVTFVSDRFSNSVGAAGFDGVSSAIKVPRAQLPHIDPTKGLTLSAWVMANNFNSEPVLEFSDTLAVGVQLWINTQTPRQMFVNLRDTVPANHFDVSPNSPIVTGRFQHIFSTYDYNSGQMLFFVDGVPAGSFYVGQVAFDTAEDLLIGVRYYAENAGHFNGAIDDLRIYNRAFRADEIQALYLRESTLPRVHPATATAQVINGFVVAANLGDAGKGYTSAPAVTFIGGGGTGVAAHSLVANGAVARIVIDNPGSGYTNLPAVVIDPPPLIHERATAVAAVSAGGVIGATPVFTGNGYTNPPVVQLIGGGGTGATAVAVVDQGEVVAIQITNPGVNYTFAPTVLIAYPPQPASLSISISKVNVTMSLTIGTKYQLQSSPDLNSWSPVGSPFVADSETLTQEFDVTQTGQYFRIIEAP